MHRDHNIFLKAIRERKKIRLVYFEEGNNNNPQDKLIAPMDYHLGHRATDKSDYYYFWEFGEGHNGVPLILEPDKIISMNLDEETFDPSELVTWEASESPWFVKRNWGKPD